MTKILNIKNIISALLLLGAVAVVATIINNSNQAGAQIACVLPPAGMVSWWPGDGNANDIIDANSGTLLNGATFAAGKVGQGFSFDGVDDSVAISTTGLPSGVQSRTIDAWIKTTVATGERYIMSYGTATLNQAFALGVLNGKLFVTQAGDSVASTVNVADGVFHHVAVTFDGGTSTYTLYVDGVAAGTKIMTTNTVLTSAFIGRSFFGNFWSGIIDELEVFNKALTSTEIAAIFNAGSAGKCKVAPCVTPPSQMVSWWPGEGNAEDIIDANSGTLVNGATFAAGKVGQAFSFDGVDDYVNVPDNANLQPTVITVDAWVFPTSFDSDVDVVVARDGGVGGPRSWGLQANHNVFVPACENKPLFSIFIGGSNFFTCGISTLPLSQWSHLAGTFDGSTIRLYVNGVLEAQTAASGNLDPAVGAPLTLGRLAGNAAGMHHFNGLIDEVEIFNRALSASEIQSIFNAGSAGKCKAGAPPPPSAVCGNAVVESGEQCDDGNTTSGDGCSSTCQSEAVTALPLCTINQVFDINGDGVFNILDEIVGLRVINGVTPVVSTVGKGCEMPQSITL